MKKLLFFLKYRKIDEYSEDLQSFYQHGILTKPNYLVVIHLQKYTIYKTPSLLWTLLFDDLIDPMAFERFKNYLKVHNLLLFNHINSMGE